MAYAPGDQRGSDIDRPTFHWKDHPLVVATLAVIGAFSITVYAYQEVVIPTQEADLRNQIRSLPDLKERIASLSSSNAEQTKVINRLQRQVEALQANHLFREGEPLPIGLEVVTIGQPVANLEKQFPGVTIDKTKGDDYWIVKYDAGIFQDAVYYFDDSQKSKPITHILFERKWDDNRSPEYLEDRLKEALGNPSRESRHGRLEWHLKRYNVFFDPPDKFVVMDNETRPAIWSD